MLERLLQPRALLVLAAINGALVVLVGYGGWRLAVGPAVAPDDFGPAPAFVLTDQLGRAVASADLQGEVVVVNFVYTNCRDTCPLLTARMAALQDRLRQEGLLDGRVQLLSLTVDPAHDTPALLRAYAERFAADPAVWRFLTGPEDTIRSVVVQGFFQGVVPLPASAAGATAEGGDEPATVILHSNRFVLVDREGRMRAFYDGLELDLDRVVRDIRALR